MTQQALKYQKFWIPEDFIEPGIEDKIAFSTQKGVLFKGDIQEILPFIQSESIDTIFADPPFNLSKVYGANVNDSKSEEEYVAWCRTWVDECIRVVKPGGAIFIYNLPKWNIVLGNHLTDAGMTFRHWIAVNIIYGRYGRTEATIGAFQ